MAFRIDPTKNLLGPLRELDRAARESNKVLERLGSGLRINRASDDAASLAISEGLRADSRILNQALKNINDGASMLAIAEGALSELTNIITRQQELAFQAANGTMTLKQREALHSEALALTSEFNRIVQTTYFNGMNLLGTTSYSTSVQAGQGTANSIPVDLTDFLSRTVGSGTYNPATSYSVGAGQLPQTILSRDLNGDGIDDLVTANSGSATVGVFLGNGNGTFRFGGNLIAESNPSKIDMADLNGDGIDDIVASDFGTSGTGSTVSVFIGNGNGTFRSRVTYVTGIGPVQIALGDINNDGTIDLLSTTSSTNFVSGNAEQTQITMTQNGAQEVNNITVTGTSIRETTNVTAVAAGTQEISTITAIAAGMQELTDITFIDAAVQEVTDLTMADAADITSGQYFTISAPSGNYYVWFNKDGAGGDPAPGGTGIEVAILGTDTAGDVATKVAAALTGAGVFSASAGGSTVTVTNTVGGAVADAANGDVGGAFAVNVTTQGVDSSLQAGDYFTFNSHTTGYYVWYRINGQGADPAVGGRTGVMIDINYGDSAATIASKTSAVVTALTGIDSTTAGDTMSITNLGAGNVTDAADGNIGGAFSTNVTQQGVNSGIQPGDHFLLSSHSTNYYVWFTVGGIGTDPAVAGRTGIQVALNWGDSANTVASAIAAAIDARSEITAGAVGSTVTVTNDFGAAVTDISDATVGGGFSVATSQQGVNSSLAPGEHFIFDTPSGNYYVWFRISGNGSDPLVAARTGIQVNINWGDSAATVAAAIAAAVDPIAPATASAVGSVVTIQNVAGGNVSNASAVNTGFGISVTANGTTSGLAPGSYFTVDTPDGNFYVWFNVGGTGSDPLVGGRTGVQVNLNWDDSATTVAAAIAAVLNPLAAMNASSVGAVLTITNATHGTGSVGAGTTTGQSIANVVDGFAPVITSGQHFLLNSLSTNYYVWYNVNGGGGDPLVAGRTGIQVNINIGDSATSIAAATAAAIDARPELTASSASGTVTINETSNGPVTDAQNVDVGGISITVPQQGAVTAVSIVADTVTTPNHGFTTGDAIQLTTTGTLPGGLSTGTTYYIIVVDDSTLKFATSLANALSGTAINLTTFGSGTHSIEATAGSFGISLLLGNSNGSFQARTQIASGSTPTAMTLRDINSDGNLDLLIANSSDSTLEVYLGRGDGSFNERITYLSGTNPGGLDLADINRDGIADAILSDFGNGTGTTVSVLLGNADGSFKARTSYGSMSGPRVVAVGDMNDDGIIDILAANFGNGSGTGVSLLLGNVDGSFGAATSFATGAGPRSVATGDYNGDGVLDVAVALRTDSAFNILLAITGEDVEMPYLSLLSVADARDAMTTLEETADRVRAQLASIGASQSRLSTAYNAVSTAHLNMLDAHDRITSADVAEEAAKLVRVNILRSFYPAIAAQANIAGEIALDLLTDAVPVKTPERAGILRPGLLESKNKKK